jgi:hypothetical protein
MKVGSEIRIFQKLLMPFIYIRYLRISHDEISVITSSRGMSLPGSYDIMN